MSTNVIRQALEIRLNLMTPALPTAWENADFDGTDVDIFQEVNLLPAPPDNSAIGGRFYREVGIFQIALYYPLSSGASDGEARAAALQAHFYRGLQLTQSGTVVTIETTPAIAAATRDRDSWRIPVSVRYRAEFFN